MITQTFPTGSHYFGALVHDPLGPVEALKEIAIPLFRSNVQDLAVVSEKVVPELSNVITTELTRTGVITSANGGKIRSNTISMALRWKKKCTVLYNHKTFQYKHSLESPET